MKSFKDQNLNCFVLFSSFLGALFDRLKILGFCNAKPNNKPSRILPQITIDDKGAFTDKDNLTSCNLKFNTSFKSLSIPNSSI